MTNTDALDLSGAFTVAGHGGIAWRVIGYAKEWTEEEWTFIGGPGEEEDEDAYAYSEPELVEDPSRVRAVMVGDDSVWTFDVEDLTPLAREDYCGVCGQVGCAHDGYDRTEES